MSARARRFSEAFLLSICVEMGDREDPEKNWHCRIVAFIINVSVYIEY